MWYTSLTGGPNTEAPKVFGAKYPGVQLEVYRGDSDPQRDNVALGRAQAVLFPGLLAARSIGQHARP